MQTPHMTMRSVNQLRPNSRNARTHPKKQIKQICHSVSRFGFTSPVVVDENDNIIAGHGRYLAAMELGLTEIPVLVVSHLSELEKRALAIADNKIAANAGWDRATLAAELGDLANLLPEINLDLSITGFESAEIDALITDFSDPDVDPADQAPPGRSGSPISRMGDVWQMGEHRLLCGDARLEADLAALMVGEQAAMVFADPPYNVSIKKTVGRGSIKHREFLQASGDMTIAEFASFLDQTMRSAAQYSRAGSIHFFCMDWRHIAETITAGKSIYGEQKNLIVWMKTNAGQGSFYRSQHELISVFKNGTAPHLNNIEQASMAATAPTSGNIRV